MATLQDIADRAGVTPMTASRVLNGSYKAKRPEAIRRAEKIRRVAAELGYRANAAARATATGRFHCACLVSSTVGHRSTLFPGLMRGAHDALDAHGMHLMLVHVDDVRLTDEGFLPRGLSEWMADGLLINYTQEIPQGLVDLVRQHRIPSVWINSRQESDCVFFDDLDGARRLCRHLLDLGHRRIAYVHYGNEVHYSVAEREAGYTQAMAEAGLPERTIRRTFARPAPGGPGDSTILLSREWLQSPERPTAVITYSHVEAIPTFVAAQDLGLRVPDELSIATFSDSVNEGPGLQISRMWTSHGTLARAAVAMLMKKIEAPDRELDPRKIALTFWEGTSCRPVPAQGGTR